MTAWAVGAAGAAEEEVEEEAECTEAEAEYYAPADQANLRIVVCPGEGPCSLGRQAAGGREMWASASVVCAFSRHAEALIIGERDREGFAAALPGDGLRVSRREGAAWRRLLAGLHGTRAAAPTGRAVAGDSAAAAAPAAAVADSPPHAAAPAADPAAAVVAAAPGLGPPAAGVSAPAAAHGEVARAAAPVRLDELRVLCCCAPALVDACIMVEAPGGAGAWECLCERTALGRGSAFFAAALQRGAWREGRMGELHWRAECADETEDMLLALQFLHAEGPHARPALPQGMCGLVSLLHLGDRYLLDDLCETAIRALRDAASQAAALAAASPDVFLGAAEELVRLGRLQTLLATWCLYGGEALAAPLAAILQAGPPLAKEITSSAAARAFIASRAFLEAPAVRDLLSPGGPIASLAGIGGLEALCRCDSWGWLRDHRHLARLLEDESLMPLLQIPRLKQELRHARFRSPDLAPVLEPFPLLFDDLLGAWFQPAAAAPEGAAPPVPDAMTEGLEAADADAADAASAHAVAPRHVLADSAAVVPAAELAAWAGVDRFLAHDGRLLEAHLARATAAELCAFARDAPLGCEAVRASLGERLGTLAGRAWRELPGWSPAVAAALADAVQLQRLLAHGVLGPRSLARLALAAALPGALWPLRGAARLLAFFRAPRSGAWPAARAALRALWSPAGLAAAAAAALHRALAEELRGARGAAAALVAVARALALFAARSATARLRSLAPIGARGAA